MKRTNPFAFNETCPTWLRAVIRDAVAEGLANARPGPAKPVPAIRPHWVVAGKNVASSETEFHDGEGEMFVRFARHVTRNRAYELASLLAERLQHSCTEDEIDDNGLPF